MSYDPQASQFEVEIKRSRHHAQKAKALVEATEVEGAAGNLLQSDVIATTAVAQIHATLSVAAATRALALDPKDDA